MSAPAGTEASAIDHGWAVYRRAMESGWDDEKAMGWLVTGLHAALAAKDALEAVGLSRLVLEALDYAAVISPAWQVCRATQEIPFPAIGGGDVLRAQSRLHHLAEPHASGRETAGADLPAIRKATADLIAAVRRYCGDGYADELGRLVPERSEDEEATAA